MESLTSPTRATLIVGRTGCSGKVPKRYSRKNGTTTQNTLSSVYPIRSGSSETAMCKSQTAVMKVSRQKTSRRYGGEEGECAVSPIAIPL